MEIAADVIKISLRTNPVLKIRIAKSMKVVLVSLVLFEHGDD